MGPKRNPPKARATRASRRARAAENDDIKFESILRCEGLPSWRTTEEATNFIVGDTAIHTPDDDPALVKNNAAVWRGLGHVTGVQVLHKWDTNPTNITALAKYNGFNEKSIANFADSIETATPLVPTALDCLLVNSRGSVNALPDMGGQVCIGPVELMNIYTSNERIKNIVNLVANHLTEPTFLPITRSMVGQVSDDAIDPAATILIHAIQVLLFAPTTWDGERAYSRSGDYEHRYPTPEGHGGNCRSVGGLYSLEDLHRAIVLVYLCVYRRATTRDLKSQGRPPQPRLGSFLGYFDVETQIPDDTAGEEGPAESAVIRILRNPLQPTDDSPAPDSDTDADSAPGDAPPITPQKPCHADSDVDQWIEVHNLYAEWPDLTKVSARVSECTTSFAALVGEQEMVEYMQRGAASAAVQEFMAEHPDDEQGLNRAIMRSYALETVFNGNPPPEDTDLPAVCARFGISPTYELYPGEGVQPLKPHQVADLGVIFSKLDTLGHVLLSNEMGLGKTKVFLSMVECKARDDEVKRASNAEHKFYPTLIVNPISTINQTHAEILANFPKLTVLMYYGSKSQSRKFGSARIVEKAAFMKTLTNMSNDDPQTARTIVLTSYSTLHCREVIRLERRFVFMERNEGSDHKRRKTEAAEANGDGEPTSGAVPTDETVEDDGDWMPLADLLAKKSQGTSGKVRKYSRNDPEVQGRRIHFLRDGELAHPDGNLIEYKLVRPSLASFKWSFLIVDEAHTARRTNGAFNNTFRLLNWSSLVWVTGTPLMSALQDILSPLSLMWLKLGIEAPVVVSVYAGHLAGLWNELYDPYSENVWPNGEKTEGIFSTNFLKQHGCQSLTQMEEVYQRTGFKVWQDAEWSSAFGQEVMTLRSRLRLPDGTVSYPAVDLLPMTVLTEELSCERSRLRYVQEHGRQMASRTFIPSAPTIADVTPTHSGPSDGKREGTINFAAFREGQIVAYDSRAAKILYGNLRKLFGAEPDKVAAALRQLRDAAGATTTQAARLKRRTASGMPTAGVEHIQKLLAYDRNAGLDFYYSRTTGDPDIVSPSGRAGWMRWLAASSPPLTRILDLCHQYVHINKERVLIYVDTPWIQQSLYASLLMAGFDTLTVRSSDKPGYKVEAISKFSDPQSSAQIFIANINIMSTGVNLHQACSKGILATFHFNAKTIQQVHGRLNRLGQCHAVVWHNIKVKDSFHDHQERTLLTKWSRQLSAEANLPKWITGALREIVLFEMIRSYWNHPFNRYAWVVLYDRDGGQMAYYSEEAIKLGHACSVVAKLSMIIGEQEFWVQHDDYLATSLLEMVARYSIAEMEGWLKLGEAQLQERFEKDIKSFIISMKRAGSKQEQVKLLKRKREERKFKSAEFIVAGDSDSEDGMEEAEEDLDEASGEDGDVEELE
ncbi:P-loop containing nucleoside triphosphate hydrolase protein [Trichoderma gracile]